MGKGLLRALLFIVAALGASASNAGGRIDFCGSSAVDDVPLFNGSTRQLAIWCDGSPSNSILLGPAASNWSVFGIANFDGGAVSDVMLINNTTSQVSIWPSGNAAAGTITGTINTGSGYTPLHSFGDFNGDGRDDLIVYSSTTHVVAVWYSGQVSTSTVLGTLATDWYPLLVADVNGDGQADLVLANSTTGEFSYWLSGNPALSALVAGFGPPWQIMAMGSFTRDPPACDILWYNVTTGQMATSQNCAASSVTGFALIGKLGWPEYPFAVGNFTGTTRTDILVYHSNTRFISAFDSGISDPPVFFGQYNSAGSWGPVWPNQVYYH